PPQAHDKPALRRLADRDVELAEAERGDARLGRVHLTHRVEAARRPDFAPDLAGRTEQGEMRALVSVVRPLNGHHIVETHPLAGKLGDLLRLHRQHAFGAETDCAYQPQNGQAEAEMCKRRTENRTRQSDE